MSRWEVFKQDAPGKPHQAVGSVHATDARHALITAAHVFVRRPSAVSLWVTRADAVYSRTAQELAGTPLERGAGGGAGGGAGSATDTGSEPYEVFRKASNRRSMTFVDHVGTYTATTPDGALRLALADQQASDGLAWWVVPTAAIATSEPEDTIAWFEPAKDKLYKQQSQYGSGPAAPRTRTTR